MIIRRRPDRIHLDKHLMYQQLTPVEYERLFKDIPVQNKSGFVLSLSLIVGRQRAETDTGASNVQPKCIFYPIFLYFSRLKLFDHFLYFFETLNYIYQGRFQQTLISFHIVSIQLNLIGVHCIDARN